jgi:hypothetical protein
MEWIAMTDDTKLTAFTSGINDDKDAVAAAISTRRSSGQVECKIVDRRGRRASSAFLVNH